MGGAFRIKRHPVRAIHHDRAPPVWLGGSGGRRVLGAALVRAVRGRIRECGNGTPLLIPGANRVQKNGTTPRPPCARGQRSIAERPNRRRTAPGQGAKGRGAVLWGCGGLGGGSRGEGLHRVRRGLERPVARSGRVRGLYANRLQPAATRRALRCRAHGESAVSARVSSTDGNTRCTPLAALVGVKGQCPRPD